MRAGEGLKTNTLLVANVQKRPRQFEWADMEIYSLMAMAMGIKCCRIYPWKKQ